MQRFLFSVGFPRRSAISTYQSFLACTKIALGEIMKFCDFTKSGVLNHQGNIQTYALLDVKCFKASESKCVFSVKLLTFTSVSFILAFCTFGGSRVAVNRQVCTIRGHAVTAESLKTEIPEEPGFICGRLIFFS